MSGSMPRSRSAALTSSFFFCSRRNFGSIAASIASSIAANTVGDHPLAIIACRGADLFRAGMDLYFARHDGQAVARA